MKLKENIISSDVVMIIALALIMAITIWCMFSDRRLYPPKVMVNGKHCLVDRRCSDTKCDYIVDLNSCH